MKIQQIIRREGCYTTILVNDSYDKVKLAERYITKKGTEVITDYKFRATPSTTHVRLRTTAWGNDKIYLRAGMYLKPQS